MPRPLVVVLDACVLYPAILRDTLLRAAEEFFTAGGRGDQHRNKTESGGG